MMPPPLTSFVKDVKGLVVGEFSFAFVPFGDFLRSASPCWARHSLRSLGLRLTWRSLGRSLRAYAFGYDSAFVSSLPSFVKDVKGMLAPSTSQKFLNHNLFILSSAAKNL